MLYIVRGTSCSGKDTMLNKFFDPSCVLSSDLLRKQMFGDMSVQQYNPQVFNTLRKMLKYRLANKVAVTVINATNMRFKDVHEYIELANQFGTPYVFLNLQPPELSELKRRNELRSKQIGMFIPETVLEKHHVRYTSCMKPFEEHARLNENCKLIEVDQDYEIINIID